MISTLSHKAESLDKIVDTVDSFMLSGVYFLTGRICDITVTIAGLKHDVFDETNIATSYIVNYLGVDAGVITKNALVCVPIFYAAKKMDETSNKGARWLAFLGMASYIAAYNMIEQYGVLKHLF